MGPTRPPSPHRAALEGLGLGAGAVERLVAYLDTLGEWNVRVNLTGARTPAERVSRLVTPVLPVASLVFPGSLLDVGSGNGSPGLVLALLRNDLDVTLLEPRTRRWAFLREAARRAGRPVRVVKARHDTYAGPSARTVTLRALSLPLAEVAPLVEPGGRLVVLGTRPALEGPFEDVTQRAGPPGVWAFRRLKTPVSRET